MQWTRRNAKIGPWGFGASADERLKKNWTIEKSEATQASVQYRMARYFMLSYAYYWQRLHDP